MDLATSIRVGALNITVSPHPVGTYNTLIAHSAGREVSIGGSDWAKLTSPEALPERANIIHGRICVWAVIEKDGAWFNKETNDVASERDKKSVVIPDNIAPNYRYFYYAMDTERHILLYEQKNEMRQSFAASKALKFFENLFFEVRDEFPEVNVTAIPEEDSLDRILGLPKLSILKIVVTKPNADDMTDDYRSVMEKMIAQKAGKQTLQLQKAPKVKRLTPDADTTKLARVASTNGYVEGKERLGLSDSTRSHPKSVVKELGTDGSVFSRFISALFDF